MLGIRLETGMAMAALALHAMFVAYISSFFIALSRPVEIGNVILFPLQLATVGIFLFGLPGFGLAAIAYILSRREALKVVSMILIAQGVIVPLGMLYASALAGDINEDFKSFELLVMPQVFMVAGIVPLGLGLHLLRLKPVKRRRMM